MKFDELANRINESFVPEMARPKNLAFQKWKEENPGVPTYKFFKQQRELKSGDKPADLPSSSEPESISDEPSIGSADILSKDPATERTRIAVADYLAHNPDASVDEVIDAIAIDSNEETPLNLEPAVVKAIIDQETPEGSASTEEEPSLDKLKKDELSAKYDRLRQALYKSRGLKSKAGRKPFAADIPGDENEDDYTRGPKINMRDEPIDPTEL